MHLYKAAGPLTDSADQRSVHSTYHSVKTPDVPLHLNAALTLQKNVVCVQAYLLIEEDIQDLSRSDEYK